MTLILNADQVGRLVEMPLLISAIERGLKDEAQQEVDQPPRLNLRASNGFFRIMPVVLHAQNVMGFKAFQGSAADGVRYMVALYSEQDGELLSLLDASYLTAARTGATTAIATKYLARPDASSVAVLGSGLEAMTNLAGVCAVREVNQVRVFSPRVERRLAFAEDARAQLGVDVRAVNSARLCTEGADIVVVATNTGASQATAFDAEFLESGMHVNSIGSTMPSLRELDELVFGSVDRVVFDSVEQAQAESGDVLAAIRAQMYLPERVMSLAALVGCPSAQPGASDCTLFKSVGTAMQDVASGHAVYLAALEAGVGTSVNFLELKRF